jgi:septal ring factor EnvC (AmiA/AmiB activator)
VEPTPVVDAPTEAKLLEPPARSVPTMPLPKQKIESATAPSPNESLLSAKPESVELEPAVDHSSAAETRFEKQHRELQTMLNKLIEQNAALESKLIEATRRLSKLEESNAELAKKLEDTSKLRETESEKPKLDKQEAVPSDKDKAPEKKGKKKPKDRIEV